MGGEMNPVTLINAAKAAQEAHTGQVVMFTICRPEFRPEIKARMIRRKRQADTFNAAAVARVRGIQQDLAQTKDDLRIKVQDEAMLFRECIHTRQQLADLMPKVKL
jgi:hypothetical protein